MAETAQPDSVRASDSGPHGGAANNEPLDERDWLQSPATILKLLRQLNDHHDPLQIYLPSYRQVATSIVLEVVPGPGAGYLVIDEFVPSRLNERISKGVPLTVRATVADVTLRFDGTITAVGHDDNAPFYRLPLPDRVHYPQRRELYRASIPMRWSAEAVMKPAPGSSIVGELRDLSVGGFCCRMTTAAAQALSGLNRHVECELHMGDGGPVVAEVAVCHVSYRRGGAALIGAAFTALSRPHERIIESWVARIARHEVRGR